MKCQVTNKEIASMIGCYGCYHERECQRLRIEDENKKFAASMARARADREANAPKYGVEHKDDPKQYKANYHREYYIANREKVLEHNSKWNKEHYSDEERKAKQREAQRKYREANREKASANRKRWYYAHREEALRIERKYYAAHRDKIAARQKAYCAAHREEINARRREYRKALKEKELQELNKNNN